MTDQTKAPRAEGSARLGPLLYILAGAFAAIAGFAAVLIGERMAQDAQRVQPSASGPAGEPAARGADMSKLVYAASPKTLPEIAFADESGQRRSLADWRGKVVLLNLWATWCAPCKIEMPGLNRLQAEMGGPEFEVVAVSLDKTGVEGPRKFLASSKLDKLALYIDGTGRLASNIGAIGLPATLILDREGREIARMLGPAEWDSAPAKAVIKAAMEGARRSAAE